MFSHRSCTFPSLDPIYHVSVSRTGGPVILGQSVTLSCDVSGSVDSISWWKNGTAMMTHNMTSLRNRSLTLDSVTKLDAGDYNCQAFNFVSNMTSSPYRLIVNCKYKSIRSFYGCVCVCACFSVGWTDACNVFLLTSCCIRVHNNPYEPWTYEWEQTHLSNSMNELLDMIGHFLSNHGLCPRRWP